MNISLTLVQKADKVCPSGRMGLQTVEWTCLL